MGRNRQQNKNHIYLSLGSQATNIFHQRFPHTDIQKCTTDALVEQLREAFIQTRNETFDRFQFFRCREKENESLEVFHSRIKKHASVCNWEHLEESLVKSIFIQGMNNQQIQMDLLSEERTPTETLQYALARERGQESQQKMINTNTSPPQQNPWFEKIQLIKRQNRGPILPTPQSGQIQDCRRCGNKFLPGHLNVCLAKNEACRICKKIGHFAKQCRSEIPPRTNYNPQQRRQQNYTNQQNYTGQQQQNRNNQLVRRNTTQRMRNINEEEPEDAQETTEETIDPESTCYIREMMEDWQNTTNFIHSINFTNEKVTDIKKTRRGEFWLKTNTNQKQKYWLGDTGSPRSFMNIQTAQNLLVDNNTKIQKPNKALGEFRCFNNNKINILGTIQVDITSGTSTAKNCKILLVDTNTINIMGRDVMEKLGLRLTMTPPQQQGEKTIFNISNTHQRISKWIFQKYPHLCTRLGRSRNHVAKSTFKSDFIPTQHKGRRIPLHLTEKVENELNKLIEEKQIKKLTSCSD